jgi:ribose 1,5-bisphosphokinase PhnN
VVEQTKQRYSKCKVVFVEVPFEIILKRILKRGREEKAALEARIERAKQNQKYPKADFVVDNSGKLENAVTQFIKYLNILGINKN